MSSSVTAANGGSIALAKQVHFQMIKTVYPVSSGKKLRSEIQKAFSQLDGDSVADIIPNKEEVTTVKINTYAGDNAFIYCVNKQPLLFQMDKQKDLYPTVYLLWRYPDLIERFTTWPPVFKKLVDGADLMLPGVIVRQPLTPSTFKHIEKGQICSVNVYGNRCPVAVGQTLLSGSDFFESGMKGKGIHAAHVLGDELWAFGDKSSPPTIDDDPLPTEVEEEDVTDKNGETKDSETTEGQGSAIESLEAKTDVQEMPEVTEAEPTGDKVETVDNDEPDEGGATGGVEELQLEELDIEEQDTAENGEGVTDQPAVLSPEEMDELLQFCFLCAVKSSVKKSDLPISAGNFYKQHVMKYCPAGKNLDVKKSTFKKLAKFLQKQTKTGIITVKELSKGVESITEIDKSHELLRGVEVPEVVVEKKSQISESDYRPPQITEMFAVTANTLPLFKDLGYTKGSALKPADVRKIITDYVKNNDLQSEKSRSEVILDAVLAELLLTRAEGDRSTLKWEEVFSRVMNKMSPVHEVILNGHPPVTRKGNVEPIKIDVVQRASNKKATIIENLDMYGIDAKAFAHTVQVKVACSASVVPSQQKNKGPQVVVQGNQIHFIAELLIETYKIPKKYLKGLEKAPKSKRR